MHINRDQTIALDTVRQLGFNPVQALVLTARHRKLKVGVVSVTAIKDDARFNIRVGVDSKTGEGTTLTIDELHTLIDWKKTTDPTTVSGCVVKDVIRHPVKV